MRSVKFRFESLSEKWAEVLSSSKLPCKRCNLNCSYSETSYAMRTNNYYNHFHGLLRNIHQEVWVIQIKEGRLSWLCEFGLVFYLWLQQLIIEFEGNLLQFWKLQGDVAKEKTEVLLFSLRFFVRIAVQNLIQERVSDFSDCLLALSLNMVEARVRYFTESVVKIIPAVGYTVIRNLVVFVETSCCVNHFQYYSELPNQVFNAYRNREIEM